MVPDEVILDVFLLSDASYSIWDEEIELNYVFNLQAYQTNFRAFRD